MVQLVGGVTAVQLTLMPLEDAAVAVSPAGAEGRVVHEVDPGMVRAMVAECVIEPSTPLIEMFVVPGGVLVCALKFTTLVPLALSEEGAKLALTPEGRPLALSETLPVRPPTKVTVIVLVGFDPGGKLIAAGDTEIVKFGSAVTMRLRVVLPVVEPLVPVTVTVAVPTVAVADAVKVSVLPDDPVTEVGLKAAVTPTGRPVAVRATVPVKPLKGVTVTLLVAVGPCITVVPVAEMLKPGVVVLGIAGNAFCTSVANSVTQKVPAGGEFGIAPVTMPLASVLSCAGSQFGSPVVEVTPL